MILETELKLTIDKADIPAFCQHQLLAKYAVKQPETAQVCNIYYDTVNHWLLGNGYVVRVRRLNDFYQQTIKCATPSKNGLHQRYEWKQQVPTLAPNFANFPDQRLCADLPMQKIIPIFTTDIERTVWILKVNQTQIELVLDRGKIISGDLIENICEIELELLIGEQQQLFEIAEKLALTIRLVPEDQSKAERGYRLHTKLGTCSQ